MKVGGQSICAKAGILLGFPHDFDITLKHPLIRRGMQGKRNQKKGKKSPPLSREADKGRVYIVISFLPLTLKNTASAIIVENVRMAEMAEATPSLPRIIWE